MLQGRRCRQCKRTPGVWRNNPAETAFSDAQFYLICSLRSIRPFYSYLGNFFRYVLVTVRSFSLPSRFLWRYRCVTRSLPILGHLSAVVEARVANPRSAATGQLPLHFSPKPVVTSASKCGSSSGQLARRAPASDCDRKLLAGSHQHHQPAPRDGNAVQAATGKGRGPVKPGGLLANFARHGARAQ